MKMKWLTTAAIIVAILSLSAASWITMSSRQRRCNDQLMILASGQFHQVAHKGEGVAMVYQYPNGQRVLRLAGLRTGAGANLQVCLIAAPDAFENETVERSGFITLGDLQKIEGDQSYPMPKEIDLNRYRAVTIWNRKYRVNYTTAPLKPTDKQR
jgi:hypothetical protein